MLFENEKELIMTENILDAIGNVGFDKETYILDKSIRFRCYFDVGTDMDKEEKEIFWDILHEILDSKYIKEKIRKMAKDIFGVYTMGDISRARKNLDKAEKAIKI